MDTSELKSKLRFERLSQEIGVAVNSRRFFEEIRIDEQRNRWTKDRSKDSGCRGR